MHAMSFMVNYYKKESNDMMILKSKDSILGYKTAAGCLLPIFLEQIFLLDKNAAIIEHRDKRNEILSWLSRCIKFAQEKAHLLIFPKSF